MLSFSALRQLRFGADNAGNVACRALLAALSLHGLALSDQELELRANCDLVEAGDPVVTLDGRRGTHTELEPLVPEVTGPILATAIERAVATAGIRWDGQVLEVTGNPIILAGATADADED